MVTMVTSKFKSAIHINQYEMMVRERIFLSGCPKCPQFFILSCAVDIHQPDIVDQHRSKNIDKLKLVLIRSVSDERPV